MPRSGVDALVLQDGGEFGTAGRHLADRALEIAERTRERWYAAELNRHKGQFMRRLSLNRLGAGQKERPQYPEKSLPDNRT